MTRCNTLLLLLSIVAVPCLSFSSTATSAATIRIADIPKDLSAIQECRRSAHAGKDVSMLLSAAKSFCNADQVQKPGYICVIAQAKDGTVLGTADLNTRSKIVNNVYVREEARKQGLAQLMMEAVEESLSDKRPTTLKLTVMSKNIPAISLYKKLGFQAPGIYGLLDASPFDFLIEMEKKLS
ncbi:hypothetical protein ACHAWT_008112 [Skeletonema menzelii]|eukprot:scaffold1472_cov157-Skeletonema_menzelii.AAC.3